MQQAQKERDNMDLDIYWKKLSPQYWLPDTVGGVPRDLANMTFVMLYICVNLTVLSYALFRLVLFALPRVKAFPESVVAAAPAALIVVVVESFLVYTIHDVACDLQHLPLHWSYEFSAALAVNVLALAFFRNNIYRYFLLSFQYTKHLLRRTPRERAFQRLFVDVEKRLSKVEISDVWFDISSYLSDPNDGVRSYHGKHQWLECFLFSEPDESARVSPEKFQRARVAFELTPAKFIDHVERLSALLTTRDLCDKLLEYLSKDTSDWAERMGFYAGSSDSKLKFWIQLYAQLLPLTNPEAILDSQVTTKANTKNSKHLEQTLQLLTNVLEPGSKTSHVVAGGKLQRFLKQSIADKVKRDKIETSWKEERLKALYDIFNRSDNEALLIEISNMLRKGMEDPHELSVELEKFQSNICVFVEDMTGEKALNYPKAIQTLRNMSVNKNEQAKVLYEAIERQQMKIALQQQIIACLEFRHALEELPNMTSTMQLPPRPAHGHAGAWKRTWRLAVECELDEMIRIYIKPSTKNSLTGIGANLSQSADPNKTSGALPAPESASPGKILLEGEQPSPKRPSPELQEASASLPVFGAEEAFTELPASARGEASAESPIPADAAPRNARLSLRELLKFDFDNWAKGSALLKEARRTKTVSTSENPKGPKGEVQEVANNGYSCGLGDSNLFDLPDWDIEGAGSPSIVETNSYNITGDEDTSIIAHAAGTALGTADSTNFIESTGTTAAVAEITKPLDSQISPDIASTGVPASAEIPISTKISASPKATAANDNPSAEDTASATGTKRESSPGRRLGKSRAIGVAEIKADDDTDDDVIMAPPRVAPGQKNTVLPTTQIVESQTTGNFKLVDLFQPDYKTWASFHRGDNMYHDLSRNIHGYGKSFDAHGVNFSSSDMLIFNWLRPDPEDFDPQTNEVMWKKVWEKRGLSL